MLQREMAVARLSSMLLGCDAGCTDAVLGRRWMDGLHGWVCGLDLDPCGVGVLRISLGWVLGCVM